MKLDIWKMGGEGHPGIEAKTGPRRCVEPAIGASNPLFMLLMAGLELPAFERNEHYLKVIKRAYQRAPAQLLSTLSRKKILF